MAPFLFQRFEVLIQRVESAMDEVHETVQESQRLTVSRDEVAARLVRCPVLFYKRTKDVIGLSRLHQLYRWNGLFQGFTSMHLYPPIVVEHLELLRHFIHQDTLVLESEHALNRCKEEEADALKELNDFGEQVLKEECIMVSTREEINVTSRFVHYFGWNGSVRICGDAHMDMKTVQRIRAIGEELHLNMIN